MKNQEKIVLNRMVDMMTRLQGFEDVVLKDLFSLHKSLTKDLKNNLKKETKKTYLSKKRTIDVLNESEIMMNSTNAILTEKTANAVVEAGQYSYTTMNSIVSWDGKVKDFNNVSMSNDKMLSLVTKQKLGDKFLKDWLGDAAGFSVDDLRKDIQKGYIKGEGYKKTVKTLLDRLDIKRTSKEGRDLESIAITYIQSINAMAQQNVYQENKSVVKQIEWSAIMEGGNTSTGKGTCPRCMALDGMRWAVDETDRPQHPLHIRCRCMLLPVTKTWKEMGFDIPEMNTEYKKWYERDKNKKIIDFGETDKNYAEWWATKSKTFQDNAIGTKRANLVRDGFIKFNKLVDRKGNLITIKELIASLLNKFLK